MVFGHACVFTQRASAVKHRDIESKTISMMKNLLNKSHSLISTL